MDGRTVCRNKKIMKYYPTHPFISKIISFKLKNKIKQKSLKKTDVMKGLSFRRIYTNLCPSSLNFILMHHGKSFIRTSRFLLVAHYNDINNILLHYMSG